MTNIVAFVGYQNTPHREWLRKLLAQQGFSCLDFKTFRDFREAQPDAELDFMVCMIRSDGHAQASPKASHPCPLHICRSRDCVFSAEKDDKSSAGYSASCGGDSSRFSRLTPRELQTLRLIALGWSSKQIAQELGIALRTVANHRASIRSKTGFTSIAQMVSAYLQFAPRPDDSGS